MLPKQKERKQGLKVTVDVFPLSEELYNELERTGIVSRIKEIPQLGNIRVNKKLSKSRYDYVLLQLYFHQVIKKNVQTYLKLTYNNYLRPEEFLLRNNSIGDSDKVSVADIIQILTIVYNIGHFYNTFTASRAVTMLAEKDRTFVDTFISCVADDRFRHASEKIFSECDYQRMHLLNSLMVLEHCNPETQSVKLAKEIIYDYINEADLDIDNKLHYVFNLFRTVRNVAYVAYDLQIANTPLTLDIWNEEVMSKFFKELLSEFNDGQSACNLVESVRKLLDDTVYNESDNAICYYQISKIVYRKTLGKNNEIWRNFYMDFWLNKNSIFNMKYSQKRDYVREEILKLTFAKGQRSLVKELFERVEKINNTRVGYYDRYSGSMTMVVSIKKACDNKREVAFKILKTVIGFLRRLDDIKPSDSRFLLTTKFFLRYLFDENKILIRPVIDDKKCVLCTKGRKQRLSVLQSLLTSANGSEDDKHEVQVIVDRLVNNTVNDVTITVPCSTLVYNKTDGQKLCEFDGIIIYPNRKEKQVILLEAKNTDKAPSYGRKCMARKLNKLHISHERKDIAIINHDAYYEMNL